tara:strand:+ start:815 stop:1243 length:429 start_codon:yes stop_codon:yes gene_type:complete
MKNKIKHTYKGKKIKGCKVKNWHDDTENEFLWRGGQLENLDTGDIFVHEMHATWNNPLSDKVKELEDKIKELEERKNPFKYVHSLHTFQEADNETYISGVDGKGKDITIIFPSPEFLELVDYEYIREKVVKHYTNLNKKSDD